MRVLGDPVLAATDAMHSPAQSAEGELSRVIDRNIRALMERRRQEEREQSRHERAAGRISAFAGSIPFVYLHAVLFGVWILVNTVQLPVPKFDPSLVILAMFASVEAIFLSTFVLITQNRMAAAADQRAELDLQISLLAEHEITRLIAMVDALCRDAGIRPPFAQELSDLERDIAPEKVLDQIEKRNRGGGGPSPNGLEQTGIR